jgi:hypothetical protein
VDPVLGEDDNSRVLRASAINNCTSCLSFGPSPALHPPAHIPICAGGCAWVTNQNPAPYCAIIYCRDPESVIFSPIEVDEPADSGGKSRPGVGAGSPAGDKGRAPGAYAGPPYRGRRSVDRGGAGRVIELRNQSPAGPTAGKVKPGITF